MKWIECPYKIEKCNNNFIATQDYQQLINYCKTKNINTEILIKFYNEIFEVSFIAITHLGIDNNKILYVAYVNSDISFDIIFDIDVAIDKIDYNNNDVVNQYMSWTGFDWGEKATKKIQSSNEIKKLVNEFVENSI